MTRPVFTPTVFAWLGQTSTVHWFFDTRVQAWSKVSFSDRNHDPSAMVVFDGDNANDRAIMLGGQDGYVRKIDRNAATDDGTAIMSYVIVGPFSAGGAKVILTELQGEVDKSSVAIKYEISAGDTPEDALNGFDQAFAGDGTLQPGRTATYNPRVAGRWIYVKLGTTDATYPWAFESVRLKLSIPVTSKGRTKD